MGTNTDEIWTEMADGGSVIRQSPNFPRWRSMVNSMPMTSLKFTNLSNSPLGLIFGRMGRITYRSSQNYVGTNLERESGAYGRRGRKN